MIRLFLYNQLLHQNRITKLYLNEFNLNVNQNVQIHFPINLVFELCHFVANGAICIARNRLQSILILLMHLP